MDKSVIKGTILFLLLAAFSFATVFLVPSSDKIINSSDTALSQKKLYVDMAESVIRINENVNNEIFELPKFFTLPLDLSPAPKPDPSKFTEDSYSDDTITVKCWRERIELKDRTVTANFADVTIVHPTQLRTAFAGGTYGTSKRTHASKMAAANNAVLAVNADFYNCRTEGLIIRQGTVYRKKPFGIDTLFIDSYGDFSVMKDYLAINTQYFKKHEIYQTVVFGPVIVEKGKAVKKLDKFNSIACGPRAKNPRTAIGQLGKLHYLVCAIDGRSDVSSGVTTNELAVIMADKKCIIAYNMDGGQSTTMVFHNKLYNVVSDGGERTMTDILYFATSVPESEWKK